MVRYICFCMMSKDFLKQPLEKREKMIPEWSDLAKKHGLKMLFWGTALGVKEHAVFVFEGQGNSDKYFKFLREWHRLGTPEAGSVIEYTRTITVH